MRVSRVWSCILLLACVAVSLGQGAGAQPESIPAAKLWTFPDKDSLDQYLIEHWGGNVKGVIDGEEVELTRFPVGSARLPNGLTVEIAGGESLSLFYQAATQRTYIVGKARVSPGGIIVENDAIGPDGQPLHLNPSARPGAPGTAPAVTPQKRAVKKQSVHFVIESNLPDPFPQAILNLCETSLAGYRDLFGLDLSPKGRAQKIRVFANFSRGGALHVEFTTPPEIYLDVPSDRALNPPGQGGPHNIFGFAHELGHLTMMFDDAQFGQGFATYLGSEVVDYLQPRLGRKAWPRPYDYVAVEGMPRLKRSVGKAEPGSENAAAVLLYEIAQKHGRKVIGEAVKQLAASSDFAVKTSGGQDYKAYHVLSFCQVLVKLTGDTGVEAMFSERGFGPKEEPKRESIPAAKLWSFPDKDSLDQFLIEHWGGNVEGVIDGEDVEMVIRWRASEMAPVKIAMGQTVEAAGGEYISIWYQPATKRTYIVGRVRVTPPGIIVENDAIGPDGQPLHLNPNPSPVAPQAGSPIAPLKQVAKQQGYGDAPKARNITAQELWNCKDEEARKKLFKERWGGHRKGLLDGMEVSYLIAEFAPETATGAQGPGPSDLAIDLCAGKGTWRYAYYQPATGRTYVVGRLRILPGGMIVEDDAVGPDGKPLRLNPNAPPAVPPAGLVSKESTHFVVETNLSAVSPDTVLRVCEAALEGYREIFGADLIPDTESAKIRLSFLGFKDASMLGLIVKPEPTPVIHYGLQVEEGWQASDEDAQAYYLDFMEGLGRLTIRFDNDKFNWGLATYMRAKIADYLSQHQPSAVNPVVAQMFRQESMAQAMKRIIDSHPEVGTHDAALALVCTVADKHGDKALGAAIRQVARTSTPVAAPLPGVAKIHRVADLSSALVEVTRDRSIETLFKESGF